jgi:hypothetical protein
LVGVLEKVANLAFPSHLESRGTDWPPIADDKGIPCAIFSMVFLHGIEFPGCTCTLRTLISLLVDYDK